MKFTSDRQRKAAFANMNMFSKGRIPKIGENVFIEGDPSVGEWSGYGTVVGTHDKSADIRFKTGKGDVVEEIGLEGFRDAVDLDIEKKFEESLYNDWLEETGRKPEKKPKKSPEFSLRTDVEDIIREGKFKLNPAAQSYYEALQESEEYYGEQGVKTQALYLANNLQPVNDEQEKLVRKLQKLGGYEPEENKEGEISEDYFGRLIDSELDFIQERKDKRLGVLKLGDTITYPDTEQMVEAIENEAVKQKGYSYVNEASVAKDLPQKSGTFVDDDGYNITIKDTTCKEEILPKEWVTDPTELIGLDDFRAYADYRGISLDLALKANDFISGYLTPEAREAVKQADQKIKVKGIDI